MRSPRIAAVVLAAAVSLGALSACSSSASEAPAVASATASSTDVAFAQSMIPHHQQAVEMADLALSSDSGASAQVQQLAKQIKAAQDPEIVQMNGWLQEWGAPTVMPGATDASGMAGMDHSGHDMGGMAVSGMMTAEQMAELARANGEQFDDMWLTMMIAHHQGAIAMAEQVQSSTDPEVTTLADAIISGQQQEIETMRDLLSS